MPEILHRTREINELELIAKPTNSQLNQIFFIYGLASTGKSISVKSVFSPKTASYASCIECFYPKLLFETLLSGFNLDIKCDSIDTFFSSISTLENKQYFLIIDDAHCLLKMNLGWYL